MEISGYHNGAWSGCLQVPVGVKIGDCVWVFFLELGKEARHGFLLVAVGVKIGNWTCKFFLSWGRGGGEFENQNPQPQSSLEKIKRPWDFKFWEIL